MTLDDLYLDSWLSEFKRLSEVESEWSDTLKDTPWRVCGSQKCIYYNLHTLLSVGKHVLGRVECRGVDYVYSYCPSLDPNEDSGECYLLKPEPFSTTFTILPCNIKSTCRGWTYFSTEELMLEVSETIKNIKTCSRIKMFLDTIPPVLVDIVESYIFPSAAVPCNHFTTRYIIKAPLSLYTL